MRKMPGRRRLNFLLLIIAGFGVSLSLARAEPVGYTYRQNAFAANSGLRAGAFRGYSQTMVALGYDCASYYLSLQQENEYAVRLASFRIDPDDFYGMGFSVGWFDGHQRAIGKFEARCGPELKNAHREAYLNRLANCRELVKTASPAQMREYPKLNLPEGVAKADFEQKLLDLTNRGHRVEAWKKILEQTKSQENGLSCMAILSLDDNYSKYDGLPDTNSETSQTTESHK